MALESELRDRARRLPDARRGAAVGDDAERVGAVELEQVGEEVELVRDLGVPRQLGHYAIIGSTMPRAVVCLPTYNERENLERMVRALGDVLPDGGSVLVIDDNSPDGTGEIADRLAAELAWVDVLHRPGKQGLGRAYVDGFRHVLAGEAELVLEIDCDFSHDPADVPRLIAAVEQGARSRTRLPLRPGRWHRELGPDAAADLARRLDLHARPPHACPRRDRRLQVLPAARARDDRARRRSTPPATSSRSRRRFAPCAAASASWRFRSASSTGRPASRR